MHIYFHVGHAEDIYEHGEIFLTIDWFIKSMLNLPSFLDKDT